MDKFSFLNAAHTSFFADLYDQYLKNPDSVEPSWRAFFQGYDFGSETYGMDREIVDGVSVQIPEQVQKEFQVVKLIDGYRTRGHLFTKTNPVRERRKYAPTLAIQKILDCLKLIWIPSLMLAIFLESVQLTLREIITPFRIIYCDSIGVEYMYIREPGEIKWIQDQLNINDNHGNFTTDEKKYILKKLNEAVSFEAFLHTKYVGQKRFSLEGNESLNSSGGCHY